MLIYLIFIFLLGIFIGSFLNVLVDRLSRGENPLIGRSHCDLCNHKLYWYDLIPIISFTLLKGKCRYCKKFIGWKYPLIELTTGILFIITLLFIQGIKIQYNFSDFIFTISTVYYFFIVSCLIVVFFSDLLYGTIPDAIILPGSIISFLYIIVSSFYSLPIILLSALGSFFMFFLLFAITNGRGMGFGDVKLSFLIGLILGYPRIIFSIYVAFLTGAFVAFILILCRKKKFYGGTLPFGPFLVIGTLIGIFWGNFLIEKIIKLYF